MKTAAFFSSLGKQTNTISNIGFRTIKLKSL